VDDDFARHGAALAVLGLALYLIRRELLARYLAEAHAHQQREWCLTTLTSIGDAVLVAGRTAGSCCSTTLPGS